MFLECIEELLKNLVLYDLKFFKVLDFGHPPQFSLENVEAKAEKVPHHLWTQANPLSPLFLKNFQTQAEKFLKSFGMR